MIFEKKRKSSVKKFITYSLITFLIIYLIILYFGICTIISAFSILYLTFIAIYIGLFLIVLEQRLNNKEDDYYNNNIDI